MLHTFIYPVYSSTLCIPCTAHIPLDTLYTLVHDVHICIPCIPLYTMYTLVYIPLYTICTQLVHSFHTLFCICFVYDKLVVLSFPMYFPKKLIINYALKTLSFIYKPLTIKCNYNGNYLAVRKCDHFLHALCTYF